MKSREFGGTVAELVAVLEDLTMPSEDEPNRSGYWVEAGPHEIGGRDRDHSYFQTINIDDENQRIFFGD